MNTYHLIAAVIGVIAIAITAFAISQISHNQQVAEAQKLAELIKQKQLDSCVKLQAYYNSFSNIPYQDLKCSQLVDALN